MSHPYIPNAVPATRRAMLHAIGAGSIEDLYASIPAELRLRRALNLPKAMGSEAELVKHVRGLLACNANPAELLSFLGGGTFPHYVPAVVDEVINRSEFLTAYAGEPYEDHGRFQVLFEYASQMGELLEMDVVTVPLYDGFQATATSLLMATRITGRTEIVISSMIGRAKLSRITDYLRPFADVNVLVTNPETGMADPAVVAQAVTDRTAAIYLETPNYYGSIDARGAVLAELAHAAGALMVTGADPITLGVLAPPARHGADIVCGDIQSLGIHQWFGGAHGGFIAVHDDPRFVMELPARLFGIAATSVTGEYGFGDVAYERTSFALRDEGKEWVGTAAALWGIAAAVYLSLMGPQGMADVGETIVAMTRYAMDRLARVPGVAVPAAHVPHFREFLLDVTGTGKSAAELQAALRSRGIEPGITDGPARLLVCVTEVHTRAEIDRLAEELAREGVRT